MLGAAASVCVQTNPIAVEVRTREVVRMRLERALNLCPSVRSRRGLGFRDGWNAAGVFPHPARCGRHL